MKVKMHLSNINSCFNEIYIEKEIENVYNTIDLFNTLISNDDISFNEYISSIEKLYNVQITENDLFKICSIFLGGPSKYTILNTDIICNVTKRIEINTVFEYLEQEYPLYLKVAFTDDNIINFNHRYSYSEINKLVKDNKIILIDLVLKEEDDSYSYNDEFNELYPLNNITDNFLNLKYIDNDYVSSVFLFLKNYFNKDRLKNDLCDYIRIIKIKVDVLENYINNIYSCYSFKLNRLDDIVKKIRRIKEK